MSERTCICAAQAHEEHLTGCPERYCTCFKAKYRHLHHSPACPTSRTAQDGLGLAALQADPDLVEKVRKADNMLAMNARQRLTMRELRVSLILTENQKRRDAERPVEPQTKPSRSVT